MIVGTGRCDGGWRNWQTRLLRPKYVILGSWLFEAAYQNRTWYADSDWEGTPNVLLRHGSWPPVVATKVGGVPELINHGENGFWWTTTQIQ